MSIFAVQCRSSLCVRVSADVLDVLDLLRASLSVCVLVYVCLYPQLRVCGLFMCVRVCVCVCVSSPDDEDDQHDDDDDENEEDEQHDRDDDRERSRGTCARNNRTGHSVWCLSTCLGKDCVCVPVFVCACVWIKPGECVCLNVFHVCGC